MSLKENEISAFVLDRCIHIHNELGPGLFESVYEHALCYELAKHDFYFERQKGIPVVYEGTNLELGFVADIIVENKVIIEIKSIDAIAPVHFKQVLTYLRLTDCKLGLLINFNTEKVKDGFHRIVNNL